MTQPVPLNREEREALATREDDFLAGILAMADDKTSQMRAVRISREVDGVDVIRARFRVRGIGDDERDRVQRTFQAYKEVRGIDIPDLKNTSMADQRALQIYTATVEGDWVADNAERFLGKEHIWDSETVQQALLKQGKLTEEAAKDLNKQRRGVATIKALLYANEIDDVIDVIDSLGGKKVQVEEVAKRPG